MLWVASPFANAVYVVDPDTGDRRTMFNPAPETSARIVTETYRRLEAGEPILPLPLYVDRAIEENERIAFNAGSLTDSVILAVPDYFRLARPTRVFEFARCE